MLLLHSFPAFHRKSIIGKLSLRIARRHMSSASPLESDNYSIRGNTDGGQKFLTNKLSAIELTNEEKNLFSSLCRIVQDKGINTCVRVAGGWVRDKLLKGIDASRDADIDLAIDNMKGKDFASVLEHWFKRKGHSSFKRLGLISRNPGKSKHFEVAAVRVGGIAIDLVNLIPPADQSTDELAKHFFGTPLEDSLGRDFTINALYFNIHTQQVEDYSGMGIPDLIQGLIRTPVCAERTISQDPLRVVRAIRFAARLQFRIDQEIIKASTCPSAIHCLATQVSKERLLNEIRMIWRTQSSLKATVLLFYFELLPVFFALPSIENLSLPCPRNVESKIPKGHLNGEEVARKGRKRGRDRESFDSIPPFNNINICTQKVNVREYDEDTYVDYFDKETAIEDISRNFNDYGFGMFLITEMLLKSTSNTDPDDSQQDNEPIKSSKIINSAEKEAQNKADSFKQKSVFSNFLSTEKKHFSNLLREISKNMKIEEIHRASNFSLLTYLGVHLRTKCVTKRVDPHTTDMILTEGLKASRKDIEAAMAAQKLSIKFATRIRRIMAFNIEQKKEKEKAKKERLSGAASNMELNNDTSTQGPRHGAMTRMDLGLLIREAGPAHRHSILLAVSSLVLQTLHQESMTQKRSAVLLYTEGAIADTDTDAVTAAGNDRYENKDDDRDKVISNIDNVKSSLSCSSAVMRKVHARIGEYLPIIDVLVTCSGVENIPHVREEHYSRKSEGLNAEEKKLFDVEFHSNTKRILEMVSYQKKKSSASGVDSARSCQHQDQNSTSNPHSVNKDMDISTALDSGDDENDDVVDADAALEIIPSILMAAENLLEAIAVFDLAECDSQPYLLNGAAIQKLLKNIPRGDAFSDVMRSQMRWMLCHPQGNLEDLSEHLKITHRDYV